MDDLFCMQNMAYTKDRTMLLCKRRAFEKGTSKYSATSFCTVVEYTVTAVGKSSRSLALDLQTLTHSLEVVLRLCSLGEQAKAEVELNRAEAAWELASTLEVEAERVYVTTLEADHFPPHAALTPARPWALYSLPTKPAGHHASTPPTETTSHARCGVTIAARTSVPVVPVHTVHAQHNNLNQDQNWKPIARPGCRRKLPQTPTAAVHSTQYARRFPWAGSNNENRDGNDAPLTSAAEEHGAVAIVVTTRPDITVATRIAVDEDPVSRHAFQSPVSEYSGVETEYGGVEIATAVNVAAADADYNCNRDYDLGRRDSDHNSDPDFDSVSQLVPANELIPSTMVMINSAMATLPTPQPRMSIQSKATIRDFLFQRRMKRHLGKQLQLPSQARSANLSGADHSPTKQTAARIAKQNSNSQMLLGQSGQSGPANRVSPPPPAHVLPAHVPTSATAPEPTSLITMRRKSLLSFSLPRSLSWLRRGRSRSEGDSLQTPSTKTNAASARGAAYASAAEGGSSAGGGGGAAGWQPSGLAKMLTAQSAETSVIY